MGAAWPGTGDLPPATALEAGDSPDARRPAPRAFARRPQWPRKGAGEGGGCSRPVLPSQSQTQRAHCTEPARRAARWKHDVLEPSDRISGS
ncbi:unnamed protein product [Rangifer tarandus platyrhynchus]|uniref:Uncharacterized protein n=1 Tax=Rangifer tarandus platyrhynchus TaxID=3082113 RepID=A0AC59YD08_RANTA